MRPTDNKTIRDLRNDGVIVLSKRTPDSNYYVRMKFVLDDGTIQFKTRTTKTTDEKTATKRAYEIYEDLQFTLKSGGHLTQRTYQNVFEEWRKTKSNLYTGNSSSDRSVEYVRLYSLDFFGTMVFEKIATKDFHRYWDWRRENFKRKKPPAETLNRERTSILSLVRFGYQRGYIKDPIFIPKNKTNGISRRPTFSLKEWKKITTGMPRWVKDGEKKGKWRDRFILQHYVLLMSNCGVRVGEMRNLKWEDVSSEEDENGKHYLIRVSGKTGERDAYLNAGSNKYLNRIHDLRTKELGTSPPQHELIFHSLRSNGPYTSFKTAFNGMLKFCNVPIYKGGRSRTIYSLRHFYATQRLRRDLNPYVLSKQMGTSVEMIEKFYGHIMTKDVMNAIKRSSNQSPSIDRSDVSYPYD